MLSLQHLKLLDFQLGKVFINAEVLGECSLRLAAFSFLFKYLPQRWKVSAMQDSRPFSIYQTICAWPRVDQFVSTYFRYQKFRLQSKRENPAKETLELKEEFQATSRKSKTSSSLPLLNLYPQLVCEGTDPLLRLPMELISSQPVLMQKSHFNVLATSWDSNFVRRDALKSQIKDQSTHIYLEGKKAH